MNQQVPSTFSAGILFEELREALNINVNIFLLLACKYPMTSVDNLGFSFRVKVVWHAFERWGEGCVLAMKRPHRSSTVSRSFILTTIDL